MHHLAAPSSRSKTVFSLLMLPLVVLTFSTLRSSLAIWNSWPNALLLPICISSKATHHTWLREHTRACPAVPVHGDGHGCALMQWLEKYTFPIEQKFNDPTFAMEWYSKLSDTMLREGITTAQYFPTTHVEATMLLADLVESRGQRGLVGLVSMDRNAPVSYVSRNIEKYLEDAEKFITYTMSKGNELVKPVITPRFVPTCSLGLLRGLGALAKKYDIHVQSHIAESKDGCYPETSAAVQKRKIRSPTARAMLAQAHYRFKMLLKYKLERAGGRLVECEEYTSKTCSGCGVINNNLGGSEVFRCDSCQAVFDRDVNAARNTCHKNMGLLL